MGAHGLNYGQPEAVGEYMASLPLGLLRQVKGAAQMTKEQGGGEGWQGVKDLVGGAAQSTQIPASFAVGEEGGAVGGAVDTAVGKVFGDVDKAKNLFDTVRAAAKAEPVPVSDEMYKAASRAMDLAGTGAKGLPRVISKFMNRVTDPDKGPVLWNEARDFYTNVSRLSANEYQSMNPQMSGAVANFAHAFRDSLQGVAEGVGAGDEFSQAMQLWGKAKSWQKFGANVWKGAKQALPFAGGTAVGVHVGRKLSSVLGGE
jgi:hypothetical protein